MTAAARAIWSALTVLAALGWHMPELAARDFHLAVGERASLLSQAPSAPESAALSGPEDVLSAYRSGALGAPTPPQGYFTPHWFVADMTAAEDAAPLVVAVWQALVARIDLWIFDGERLVDRASVGVTLDAASAAPRFAAGYALPLDIPPGGMRTVVLRIEPLLFLATDIEVTSADRASWIAALRGMLFPALIGVYIGVALLHVVLWLRFGDWRNGLFASALFVSFVDWFIWLGGPQALGLVNSRDLGVGLVAGAHYAWIFVLSLLFANIFGASFRRRALATLAILVVYLFYVVYPLVPRLDAERFLLATHVLTLAQAAVIVAVALPALARRVPGTRLALAGAGLSILQSVIVFTPLASTALEDVNTALTAAIGHFDIGDLAVSIVIVTLLSLSLWDRHRAEMRARDAAAREARLQAVRAAQICHDIRSPLHAVQSLLTALDLDAGQPVGRNGQLTLARGALGSVRALVEDIVAAAREGPPGQKPVVPVDLEAVAHLAAAAARAEGASRHVDAVVRMAPGAPRTLIGDRLALERVLCNLAINAARAARAGPVEIAVEAAACAGHVRLTVRDDGTGLPPAAQDTLLAQAECDQAAAAGMGLVVVRTLAAALGARLHVRTKGDGTCVAIELPIGDAGDAGLPADRLRVLLIDDDDVTLAATAAILRADGHEVWTARNAAGGVTLAARGTFDAAVVDLDLGDDSGCAAIRGVRQLSDPVDAGLPILVTSGHGDILARARACGAQGILPKPFDQNDLRAALSTVASPRSPVVADHPHPHQSKLAALAETLSPEGFAEVVDSARRQIHGCAQILARSDRDAEVARRAAHRLGGAAAIVGFEALSTAARAFERDVSDAPHDHLAQHRRVIDEAARAALAELDAWQPDDGGFVEAIHPSFDAPLVGTREA